MIFSLSSLYQDSLLNDPGLTVGLTSERDWLPGSSVSSVPHHETGVQAPDLLSSLQSEVVL